MAREFSSAEAKSIIEEHNNLLQQLDRAENAVQQYRQSVKNASDTLVNSEVEKLLGEIPIEEINREKRGFRVKVLRENGYNTIADIVPKSVSALASVHGISEDAAYSIKKVAGIIAMQVRQGVKLRLSTDSKTKEATRLVSSLNKYRRSLELYDLCTKLSISNKHTVKSTIEDLKPAQSKIKWFFTSADKKQKALSAYNLLTKLKEGYYFSEARKIVENQEKIDTTSDAAVWDDFSENSVLYFKDLENINPGVLGNDDSMYGLPEEVAEEVQGESILSDGLLCELRKYQEWGVKYILHGKRVLLGDEMGLGKTVQAIASMVSLGNVGATHFIVVCPASVISNWCREIRKMSLLSVTKIHGSAREAALSSWIKTGGVAVTTYETTGFFKLKDDFKFAMLVVDEAHYIKNPEARRTVNVKRIADHTDRRLFMTGTALENRVDEMIELIKMLRPEIAEKVQGMESVSVAPQFRKIIAPVYYRRKREDVLTELPELIETKEWCVLGKAEEEIYERAVLSKNYSESRRVSWNAEDMERSSKANRLLELIDEAESEGRKVIVFSFFLDTVRKISQLLGARSLQPINGSVSPERRQEIIDEFDKSPAGTVLLAQIQSGGTGLNIQSASVVIICEPQFKPSIENQAISRAYRMGQTRNVLVYRLLCENTVDERITALLESKQAIFDAFADKSVAAEESKEVDERTFGNIIKDEIDRINAKYSDNEKMNNSPEGE